MAERSFVRWQTRTIKQLSYATDLIVALAAAGLGFGMTLVRDSQVRADGATRLLVAGSLLLFLLSLGAGLCGIVNRLVDFRLTTRIARIRETDRNNPGLLALRESSRQRGELTWTLFCLQLAFFAVAVLAMVIGVASHLLRAV